MMLAILLAFGARHQAARILLLFQELQTGIIVWELSVEVVDREP